MISNSIDFILNTEMEYPAIIADGITNAPAFSTTTLYAGVPDYADYQVFQKVVSGTYGIGYKKVKCWVDATGNLKCSPGDTGDTYWRIYAY